MVSARPSGLSPFTVVIAWQRASPLVETVRLVALVKSPTPAKKLRSCAGGGAGTASVIANRIKLKERLMDLLMVRVRRKSDAAATQR
jgi:hypothetical protein